jgi:hypothetical protein
MSRRLRWILLALVVVIVGGAAALVLIEKPKLDDARDVVDARWAPLRAPDQLVLRYQKLEGALSVFDAAGGANRAVSKDLHAALEAWQQALKSGDTAMQAERADVVEAQGTRLRANVLGSQRLLGVAALMDALAAFAGTTPPAPLVGAYNRAVHDYEEQRTGTLQRPIARVFGYDSRPVLALGA